MDKVKLTQKQADVLETMKAKGAPLNEIVARHIDHDYLQVNDYEEVSGLSTDTIIRALYIGYEVEQTPEDKVREYFKVTLDKANSLELSDLDSKFYAGEYRGIQKTLFLLKLKLEGVNDHEA